MRRPVAASRRARRSNRPRSGVPPITQVVILAGGYGTRLAEETGRVPKPMVEIGGKPILWHIMRIYASHGLTDFVICLGYKGYLIKEYFSNYSLHNSDVTFDLAQSAMTVHQNTSEPWRVTLVETGGGSGTGGRLRAVARYIGKNDFCLTYGDGVADVDIGRLLAFHRGHGRLASLTAVQAPSRYGVLSLRGDRVARFREKPVAEGVWINGGFLVLSPRVIKYIADESTSLEEGPLRRLAAEGELRAFPHKGFWQCMDTLRDKIMLEELWASGAAPWKVWR